MSNQLNIEDMLSGADFSRGHKSAVWGKVLSRLQGNDALSMEELDSVAGGASNPYEEIVKDANKDK